MFFGENDFACRSLKHHAPHCFMSIHPEFVRSLRVSENITMVTFCSLFPG